MRNNQYTRTNGGQADNVWPEFFMDTTEDQAASARDGITRFKDEERVRIHFPGDQTKKPVFKVTQEYISRWPKEYEAFKAGIEMALDGTPLEQWAFLNKKSQVLELKAMGFRTVEDLAGMNDLAVQRIGLGGSRLRENAIAYLDQAKEAEFLAKATAKADRLETEVAELRQMVETQHALNERLSAQLLALQNAPSPIATYVPAQHDPIEQARMVQPPEPPTASAFDSMPAPRRRGRPPSNPTPENAA